tara:strand:+ start:3744 stop:4460 length:717 start_codon:yes stop_codon:yes gene_type:complete
LIYSQRIKKNILKKTILIILASFFIQCSNNLNNLTEEAFHGRWSSHVQYTETISTDVVFSIDSITDLIFLEEMTLVQYELDENNQRMPSTDFVDRSTPDRDIIKQKVIELLGSNGVDIGPWMNDPNETYEFKTESGINSLVFEQIPTTYEYRFLDVEVPQMGKRLQYYAPTGWTDFVPNDEKNMIIKSVRKRNRIGMESENLRRYNFRMNAGFGSTGPFDINGTKSQTTLCNFELRSL